MKNSLKHLIRIMLFALLLAATNTYAQTTPTTGFVLKGVISGSPDGTMVRLVDIDGQKVLDSAMTISGTFALKGHVNKPTTCWLQCYDEYATIQVENTPMTFTSVLKGMNLNYTAHGGREQSLQNLLNDQQRQYERIYTSAYDSLNNKLYSDTSQKSKLIKTFKTAQDTYMNIYVAFGRKHIASYMGLDIVYRNRLSIPKDSLVLLYNNLPNFLKATSVAHGLHTYATKKLASKGEHFLDFEAQTIEGTSFKLSELKGKYIYLAFGSFSCGPCRMENREIAKHYGELSKHMAVVNSSLDINRKEWEAAAKLDSIIWYNVSDMAGMTGRIKTLYNVQAMPTSFLINPDGLIIERFDGYSDENITKVARIASGVK